MALVLTALGARVERLLGEPLIYQGELVEMEVLDLEVNTIIVLGGEPVVVDPQWVVVEVASLKLVVYQVVVGVAVTHLDH